MTASSTSQTKSRSNENDYDRIRDDDSSYDTKLDTMRTQLKNDSISDSSENLIDLDEAMNNKNGSSYTYYIQMAYNQINDNLGRDKELIIEIIRKKKNNDFKLKELEKLKVKVNNSLTKLKHLDENLILIIKSDESIESILNKLSGKNPVIYEPEN